MKYAKYSFPGCLRFAGWAFNHGVRRTGCGYYSALVEGAGWQAVAFKFTAVAATAPDTITATGNKHKLTYKFLSDAIEMAFSHTAEPTI